MVHFARMHIRPKKEMSQWGWIAVTLTNLPCFCAEVHVQFWIYSNTIFMHFFKKTDLYSIKCNAYNLLDKPLAQTYIHIHIFYTRIYKNGINLLVKKCIYTTLHLWKGQTKQHQNVFVQRHASHVSLGHVAARMAMVHLTESGTTGCSVALCLVRWLARWAHWPQIK